MKGIPPQFSFLDHLEELRSRIIKSLIFFVAGCFAAYGFADRLLRFLIKPVGHVVFLSPGEAFSSVMTVTLWGGAFFSSPFILYQIWAFVARALTESERKYVVWFAPLSLILFLLGAVFGYCVIVPVSLKFLLSFGSDLMVPMISASRYLSFIGTFVLSFGVVFELPLMVVFLSRIGIASPEFLRQKRRYAIVLIFIISAILTPPDVVSQLLMAVPLIFLYELGIFLSRFFLTSPGARL